MELKKILLVEDDVAFNFLNRKVLKENQVLCQVDEALNGKAALKYLANTDTCPDVILLDINMPVMDGFEFLEEFEKQRKCLNTSNIFILTSSNREEDREQSLKNKLVKGYFDKPLNKLHIEQILSLIGSK
jgi:CheY-like chemotaxis protein